MQTQRDLRDEAERPLATSHERHEIRSGLPPAHGQKLTVAQHALEPGHHVFDFSVATRALAGATSCDPTAHRGANDARGKVAGSVAVLGELLLELQAEHTRTRVHDWRLALDAKLQQALGVDHDRAFIGQNRATHAAARSEGHEPKALRAGQLEQLAHLLGALGPNYGAWAIVGQRATLNIDQGTWPKVARGRAKVRGRPADCETRHAEPNS